MTGFGKLWAGQTISQFGDRITELGLPLIAVTTLAAGATEIGLLTAAVWLPNLLSILVGSWVDGQAHRRRLLVIADLLRALVLLSLPVAHWFGVVTLVQLFAVALLTGAGQVLFHASYQSFFVLLVPRERFVEANSKLSTSRSASFVAGPALGGFLIQILTAPVAMLIDAVSFLASALFISRIRVEPSVPAESTSPMAGLRYVLGHRYLRGALACVTTVNFFSFVAAALVVLFASRSLGLSAGLIGLAFGLGAVGGLLGAVVAPRLSRRYGIGRLVVLGAILFPASIAVIALAGGPTWMRFAALLVAEAISGFGVMIFDINLNSVMVSVTTDEMRARASGVFGTINYGARPLGAAVGGLLGTWLGLRPTLLVAAIGGALCCLWLLPSPIPAIRNLDLDLAA
ncbi:MFS transporter [Actinoplanes sp. NPDC051633]|uniref:MFS transporter n=1 Tax=Actinoplanes sp. NPDC051633 TaxID=3155670 RepID=UPI00343D1279